MNNFYNDIIVKFCQQALSENNMQDISTILNENVNYNDYQNIWKNYLDALQISSHHSVAFMLELDAWPNSFFNYLQNSCDLNYNDNYIYNQLNNIEIDKKFWNESINDLISIFGQMYSIDENGNINFKLDQIINLSPDFTMTIEDIRKADAGFSFSSDPYVKPNDNIDNQTYWQVRTNDIENEKSNFITKMLQKKDNLQFTQSPPAENNNIISQMRLLMPKYSHRVSVEDLNRNFWVIGQSLSGVCSYLFNEESPLSKILKGFTSELSELWENILYLWSVIATEFQEDVQDIHVEHLLMPINEFKTRRYDDTGSPFILNEWLQYKENSNKILDKNCKIVQCFNYLKYNYSKSQLCIIPFLREQYYKAEHYKVQKYFGIIFYDRFKDEWSFIPFNNELQISIDEQNSSQIGCLRKENTHYLYAQPFSDIESEIMATNQQEYLYAMLRLDLDINVQYENGFIINNLSIKTYDAAAEAVNGIQNNVIDTYYMQDKIIVNENNAITLTRETSSIELDILPVSERNYNYGFYTGELISNYGQTTSKEPAKFITLKLGNMMPVGFDEQNIGAKLYETAEFRKQLESVGITPDINDINWNDAYKEAVYGQFDLHLGRELVGQYAGNFNSYQTEMINDQNCKQVKFMANTSVNGLMNLLDSGTYENYDTPLKLQNLNQETMSAKIRNYYNCDDACKLEPSWVDYEKINNFYLQTLGHRIVEIYCKNFYNKDEKRMFFITKFGGRYWMGANGSQQSWGRYCHMFIAQPRPNSNNEFDIECVGLVNKNKIYDNLDLNQDIEQQKYQRELYYGGMLDKPFVLTSSDSGQSDVEQITYYNNENANDPSNGRIYLVNKGTKEKVMQDYTQAYFSNSNSIDYNTPVYTTWRQVTFYANLVSYKIQNGKGSYVFMSPYITIKDYNKIFYGEHNSNDLIYSPINNDIETYNEWTEIAYCKLSIKKDENSNDYNIEFIDDKDNKLRAMHCFMDGINENSNYKPTAVNDVFDNHNGFFYNLSANGRIDSGAWNSIRRGRDGSKPWDYDIFGLYPLGYMDSDPQYGIHNIINHTAPLNVLKTTEPYYEFGGPYIIK